MPETETLRLSEKEAIEVRFKANPVGEYQNILRYIRTFRKTNRWLTFGDGFDLNTLDFRDINTRTRYMYMSDADIAMLVIRSAIPDFEKPKLLKTCPECGKELDVIDYPDTICTFSVDDENSPGYLIHTDEHICHECFERMLHNGDVYMCDICQGYYREDVSHSTITDDNCTVCPTCLNLHTFTCDTCGGAFSLSNRCRGINGNFICSACADEEYYVCNDCDCYVHCNEVEWVNDIAYCPECARNHEYDDEDRFDEDSAYVHVYNWKPRGKFYDNDGVVTFPDRDKVYFGIELEVSGSQRHAPEFLDFFNDTDFGYENQVYLKSDCSIRNGGFEIVTHPMTFDYIKNTFAKNLQEALDDLKKKQFKGHNYGGMHVHMSRSAIPFHQYKRLIEMFSEPRNKKAWLFLTQRKESELNQWGSLNIGYLLTGRDEVYLERDYDNYYIMNSNRYVAVNTTKNTVELRIFNSNLRIERVLKNIEICQALLDFTAPKQRHNLSMPAFIKYVRKHKDKFSNLVNFLDEKNWDDTCADCFADNIPDDVTDEA